MSDMKISHIDAKLRFPDGEVKPFSVVASHPTSVPVTLPKFNVNSTHFGCEPEDSTVSLLLNQNKDILQRLEKVDQYLSNPPAPPKQVDVDERNSVDLNKLKELCDTQAKNMEKLRKRMDLSDNKIEVLEAAVAEKDQIIASQNAEIEQLKRTITLLRQENTSVDSSKLPEKKLQDANKVLEKRNNFLEERHLKELKEIVDLKSQITSDTSPILRLKDAIVLLVNIHLVILHTTTKVVDLDLTHILSNSIISLYVSTPK